MSRIVLQSDIDQQYQKTCMLTDNFGSLAVRMVARLIVLTSSFKKCSGQTTIISACRLQAKNLMNVTDSLKDCAELLRISKDTMQNLDATIRQEINNQDLMSLNQLSYGDTTSNQIVANQDGTHTVVVNDGTYRVLNYEPYVLSQNDDNINRDHYMDVNGVSMGCTITCMAIIWWMMHGQDAFRDPSEFCVRYDGANSDVNAEWAKGNISMSGAMSQSDALATAYSQLSEGKPCMMYANHSNGSHAVVIVGAKEGVDASSLSPNDFLVIDPWDGQTKSLSDIGYYSDFKIGTYIG